MQIIKQSLLINSEPPNTKTCRSIGTGPKRHTWLLGWGRLGLAMLAADFAAYSPLLEIAALRACAKPQLHLDQLWTGPLTLDCRQQCSYPCTCAMPASVACASIMHCRSLLLCYSHTARDPLPSLNTCQGTKALNTMGPVQLVQSQVSNFQHALFSCFRPDYLVSTKSSQREPHRALYLLPVWDLSIRRCHKSGASKNIQRV